MGLYGQDPGRRDRRLILRYSLDTRSATGAAVKNWIEAATVWGEWLPQGGREFTAARAKHAEATGIFRIKHRTDVDQLWQIAHGDDLFEVIAPVEVGRRDFLDLIVRALNQSPGSALSVHLMSDGTPRLLADGSFVLMPAA